MLEQSPRGPCGAKCESRRYSLLGIQRVLGLREFRRCKGNMSGTDGATGKAQGSDISPSAGKYFDVLKTSRYRGT